MPAQRKVILIFTNGLKIVGWYYFLTLETLHRSAQLSSHTLLFFNPNLLIRMSNLLVLVSIHLKITRSGSPTLMLIKIRLKQSFHLKNLWISLPMCLKVVLMWITQSSPTPQWRLQKYLI